MVADIVSPIYFGPPGLFLCSVIFLFLITLVEGAVFRLLRWGSWKVTLLHAFIINLVTALLGTGLLTVAGNSRIISDTPFPVILIILFVSTVFIEAFELKVLRRSADFSHVIRNSLIANFFSYAFVCAAIFLTLFPPVIGYSGGAHRRPTPPPSLPPTPAASPRD